MVTKADPTEEQALVTQAEAAILSTESTPAETPETDWKAEAEKYKAEAETAKEAAAKAEQNRRTEEGRRRKLERETQERAKDHEAIEEIKLRQEAIEKGLDPDEHVRTNRSSQFTKDRESATNVEASRVWREAQALGVNPNEDEAFAVAQKLLGRAKRANNLDAVEDFLERSSEAADAALVAVKARKTEEAKAQEPPAKAKGPTAAEVARTQALEGHGAGTASSGMSDAQLEKEYAAGRLPFTPNVQAALKRLGHSL